MNKYSVFAVITVLVLSVGGYWFLAPGTTDTPGFQVADDTRLITVGSSITETVFALGGGDYVVGVDSSSNYPPEVHELPKVPYIRNLNAEGILSLEPDAVITHEDARPKTVLKQLRNAGVKVIVLTDQKTPQGAYEKIRRIGEILGKTSTAERIIQENKEQLARARERRKDLDERPSVLYVMSAGSGQNNIMAAGKNSAAHKMIELAGARNVMAEMKGLKPVNPEVIAESNPDYVVMMKGQGHQVGEDKQLDEVPGLGMTRAVKQGNVIPMGGNYLLGFGPRTGEAVLDLMDRLHDRPDSNA
jgi:iron complex transport system substrate-binding protein